MKNIKKWTIIIYKKNSINKLDRGGVRPPRPLLVADPRDEKVVETCAAHIGMDGLRIEKEPRQRDEYVYRIS
jgi:hypothetical protein